MSRIAPSDGETVSATPRKSFTPKQRLEVLLAHKDRCARCKDKITDAEWEVNHIIPISQGGPHEPDNWEPVHKACHKDISAEHAGQNAKIKRLQVKHSTPRDQWPKAPGGGFRRREW